MRAHSAGLAAGVQRQQRRGRRPAADDDVPGRQRLGVGAVAQRRAAERSGDAGPKLRSSADVVR